MPQDQELSIVSAKPLPDDLQILQAHADDPAKPLPHPVIKRMLDWLPTVGGTVGGLIGGALDLPTGAVPGAIGGAAVGGAAGASAAGMINHAIGNTPDLTNAAAAKDVATQAAVQGGSEAVGRAIPGAAMRLGGALMQSAVKPGVKEAAKAIARGVAPENLPIVKTLLNEGVNVSAGGIEKLTGIINASNTEIKAALDSIPGSVSSKDVVKRLNPLASQVMKQTNPASAVKDVAEAGQEFLATHPDSMSLADAQANKIGTYKALKDTAYGALRSPQIEAQKALGRGLKEEIEAEAARFGHPEIGALNAKEGAAMTAREAVAKRLAQAGNRDPVALAWLAAHPAQGIAYVLEKSPAVKSMIARGLYGPAVVVAKVPGLTPSVLRGMVASIASATEPTEVGP